MAHIALIQSDLWEFFGMKRLRECDLQSTVNSEKIKKKLLCIFKNLNDRKLKVWANNSWSSDGHEKTHVMDSGSCINVHNAKNAKLHRTWNL